MTKTTSVSEHELAAIVGGYHGDPFAVLGPHTDASIQPHWEVRVFLPQAQSARLLLPSGESVDMDRLHDAGFWVAATETLPGGYRIEITDYAGVRSTIQDPYRFGPQASDFDLHLFAEGNNYESFNTFGAHVIETEGVRGVRFVLWAPNAIVVSVIGNFNDWDTRRHTMRNRGGVWEIFLPEVKPGDVYKYAVKSRFRGVDQMKADPVGFEMEQPPKTASVVTELDKYEWNDHEWMEQRAASKPLDSPVSVYEVHLGSWRRDADGNPRTYRQLASELVDYVKGLGFTHIELMPIAEHPYAPSWGYQVTGYFAPTSRFGTPEDFMFFVDACHQAGLGVIMDWVPGHFPRDAHGLAYFDGTALYEHEDPRLGEHREWGTLIFNYGRNEVRSFLISNAMFWLRKYHIDGLRVDAVASMLYLDYSRKAGEWIPNIYGGNENLEAISFLRRANELAHQIPGVITVAEESTAFTGVSRPTYLNGLGFTMKWNMGWMHDMLRYFSLDPVYRKYHQNEITFSMVYAFTENFVLPISHDEVVYGKRNLLDKMPGDEWQRFANARTFLSYMWGHPGKKLLFMGAEFGQTHEWNSEAQLEWWLLEFPVHQKLQQFIGSLNWLYRSEPALYEVDFQSTGFEWIDFHDAEHSIVSFVRYARNRSDYLVFVCNFTPQPYMNYRIGLPERCGYREVFNSDAEIFGGSNMGNGGWVEAEQIESHGRPASVELVIPPLATVVLKPARPISPIREVGS